MTDLFFGGFWLLWCRYLGFSLLFTSFMRCLSWRYDLKLMISSANPLYLFDYLRKITSILWWEAIFPAFPGKIYTRYFPLQARYSSGINKTYKKVAHHPKFLVLSYYLDRWTLIKLINHWKLQNTTCNQCKISLFESISHQFSLFFGRLA